MKLRHIAAAAIALAAGQAFALDNTTMNAAGTVKLYVSGSSALNLAVAGLFTQNCTSGTLTTYTRTGTGGTIYSCSLIASNDFTLPTGTNVMLQKYDDGGSGNGVFPVGNVGAAASALPFIDPTTCTGGASGTGTCTGTANREPDAGVSDEEPKLFTNSINKPSAFASATLNTTTYTTVPAMGVIEGVALSQKLFDALCSDQGISAACTAGTARPSVARGALAMILSNTYYYDVQGWKPLFKNSSATGADTQVNICRRGNGSGTQAAFNRYFNEYPVNTAAALPWTQGDRSTATISGTATGLHYVEEGASGTAVKTCLTNAGTTAFAVGVLAFDQAEPAAGTGWKYAAIDGVSPSRAAAQQGKYDFFVEATCQYRNALTGNIATLAQKFCSGAASPVNLNAIADAATKNGVMTPPTNAACPGSASPATDFCSAVTRGGNTANQPYFY